MDSPIIIHIPHSSEEIPQELRKGMLLSDAELRQELLNMTDRFTGDLFSSEGESLLCFPISRLVCDPERFRDDNLENMSSIGMGAVYTRCSDGRVLRPTIPELREWILKKYYDPHHMVLAQLADEKLRRFGGCLIIDGHSFPSVPLHYEPDQSSSRPDFCIGTDSFHTPAELTSRCVDYLMAAGYSVEINRPFSGAIVPMRYYRQTAQVMSIMVEVNRGLYMTKDGSKSPFYNQTKRVILGVVDIAKNYAEQTDP